jgi:hypothetical protein
MGKILMKNRGIKENSGNLRRVAERLTLRFLILGPCVRIAPGIP